MSRSIIINGYAGKESKEFRKHLAAVKFCICHELSLPKETSVFFKGKIDGEDLEAYKRESWLECIENGIEIDLPIIHHEHECDKFKLKMSEIPKEVEEIIIYLS